MPSNGRLCSDAPLSFLEPVSKLWSEQVHEHGPLPWLELRRVANKGLPSEALLDPILVIRTSECSDGPLAPRVRELKEQLLSEALLSPLVLYFDKFC